MKKTNQTIVMSLGGSLIAPKNIDIKFLKEFKKLILDYIKKGNKVVLICGGGNTARDYQLAAKKINSKVTARDLDWVGIGATKINAQLISAMFGDLAHESIIDDPSIKINTTKKIIVGAGYEPGHSSDNDAVIAARTFKADMVINLSNITYVYDKDPNKFKNAKPQTQMSWAEFLKLVGDKWIPGAHVPFDPIASKLAKKLNLTLVVMRGNDLKNLNSFLMGGKFKGTVVK